MQKDNLSLAQPSIDSGCMQICGLSVAQPNVNGEQDNVCGPTSSSGEICRNCTVCGKLCVVDGECTDFTERLAEQWNDGIRKRKLK